MAAARTISNFTTPVYIFFKAIPSKYTLIVEQKVLIRKLADSLKEMVSIKAVSRSQFGYTLMLVTF